MSGIHEQVFGSVLLVGVGIRQGRYSHISQSGGTGIRTHRKESHANIREGVILGQGLGISSTRQYKQSDKQQIPHFNLKLL